MKATWKLATAVALITLAGSVAARSAEGGDEALLKALPGAKITLLQGIAQVAKGTEVPTEVRNGQRQARAYGLHVVQGLRYRC
jgi:hypothetical protein